MIVSHKHKFIFIKTKKTAGTSIEIVLSKICGDDDIITPINEEDEIIRNDFSGRRSQHIYISFLKYSIKDWLRFLKYRKRIEFYNHMPAYEIKSYVDSKIWDTYYKFCFEREPIKKTLSHFTWRSKKVHYPNFEAYLNSGDISMIKGNHFYKNETGDYLVDKVFKMEEMEIAFKEISERLGLKEELQMPRFNTKKSKKDPTINLEDIEKKFGNKLRDIFETEYKDLYRI